MKKLKKFIIPCLFLFILSARLVWAVPIEDAGFDSGASIGQSAGYFEQTPETYEDAVYNQPPKDASLQRYVSTVGTSAMSLVICGFRGCGTDQNGLTDGGAAGLLAKSISFLYSVEPASSVEYLADLGSNLNFVPKARAQGMGFYAFSPVLSLWKFARNICYLLLTIVFVITGFMIMFRTKLNPQTVISIQNSIPRLVVALILVTFSYAIAGLMIDLGHLITRIIAKALQEQGLIATSSSGGLNPSGVLNNLLNADVFTLINPLRDMDKLVREIGQTTVGAEGLPAGLSTLTVRLVFWIAGFFIMFKIFFALLMPYVTIILGVIFGPFQILFGSILGGGGGVGNWIKQLLAGIMVFPVTFAMLAIAAVIKGYTAPTLYGPHIEWGLKEATYKVLWYPATIGNWGGAAAQLVSFGILFSIPQVATIVQQALKYQPPQWSAAAMTEIKTAGGRIPVIGGLFKGM